jgi:transcription antitermination factor NusG
MALAAPAFLAEPLPLAAEQPQWYAIYTRSRHEKHVAQQLGEKRVEHFLPLHKAMHRWQDRYKEVELPLFSSYVFAHFPAAAEVRLRILRTPGVVRIVGFGMQDAPVPAEQIESLRRILESNSTVTRHRYLKVGQRVRIISGALSGVEGILKRMKNCDRLVVAIEPIRQSVAIEVSGYEVLPLG